MTSADNYQHLVGKTLIEADKEAGFQRTDDHVLESELPEPSRVEKPDNCYTCEFREERLRIGVDENNVIRAVMNG
ncbi:hypothetical protein CONCODRAFT_15543 [Conidiobolus coronatus NRRL 28638]|uniref:Uncharacterized protein n=1 Tax=Conidiobolus coronatus (strain ATCC 28846 / CBS 209.66 / NRRL 28638) TaxID=796925 RepID=A0A137PEL5_CONC2|nr:hypothetical protein CONCODRAFT_15543 [Conidiobolus coronatus NRRL 28638]|eukprot:KXN73412.1 hypothetical protein CONCODRAFT_15543 [Conidiobolus coronatus NRRL 28638]